MVELLQHLEDASGYPKLALDRLVGIGVGAERNDVAAVTGFGQLGAQQLGPVLLDEDAALEIESRREAEIGVGRPRIAIDAAVLAATIGIDRTIEADIGRIVPRNDAA